MGCLKTSVAQQSGGWNGWNLNDQKMNHCQVYADKLLLSA